jgi:hypothetical protein
VSWANTGNKKSPGPNVHKTYQHTSLQDPPKFAQIWIFGLKKKHLATIHQALPCPLTVIAPDAIAALFVASFVDGYNGPFVNSSDARDSMKPLFKSGRFIWSQFYKAFSAVSCGQNFIGVKCNLKINLKFKNLK